MFSDVFIKHFIEKAKKFGYEIRYANSWNSYDWLTDETIAKISKTMQNSKID